MWVAEDFLYVLEYCELFRIFFVILYGLNHFFGTLTLQDGDNLLDVSKVFISECAVDHISLLHGASNPLDNEFQLDITMERTATPVTSNYLISLRSIFSYLETSESFK